MIKANEIKTMQTRMNENNKTHRVNASQVWMDTKLAKAIVESAEMGYDKHSVLFLTPDEYDIEYIIAILNNNGYSTSLHKDVLTIKW